MVATEKAAYCRPKRSPTTAHSLLHSQISRATGVLLQASKGGGGGRGVTSLQGGGGGGGSVGRREVGSCTLLVCTAPVISS